VKGRACCRLWWFVVAEMVAGPGGAAIFLLLPRAEVPIPASSPSLFLYVFLFSVLPSLSSLYSSVCFFFFLSQFSFFSFRSPDLFFFFSAPSFLLFSVFRPFLSSSSSSSFSLFCSFSSLPLFFFVRSLPLYL